MRELRPGLRHWTAPHPDWRPSEPWDRAVSSYALDDGERLLLFDPLAVPDELIELAGERETAIVLTAPWHERDTRSLVERLGAPVYTPRPHTQADLMEKFGVTAEQAAGGSPRPRLAAGRRGRRRLLRGGQLPFGAEAFPGRDTSDLVLCLERAGAAVSGDTLADFGRGLEIPAEWLWGDVTREQVADRLRPLLELPIEHVLPTHGAPTDRAALEGALA